MDEKTQYKIDNYESYGKLGSWCGFETMNFKLPGNAGVHETMLLLDTSGSMNLPKPKKESKLSKAHEVITSCIDSSITTNYYTFTTSVISHGTDQSGQSAFLAVKADGGTKIHNALTEMFNIGMGCSNAKNLLIITDAEDKINLYELETLYESAVKTSRNNGGYFMGSCLLVGNGACKEDLKDLFRGAFYHSQSSNEFANDLRTILEKDKKIIIFAKKLCEIAIDAGNVPVTHDMLNKLKQYESENEQFLKDLPTVINNFQNDINNIRNDIQKVQNSKYYKCDQKQLHKLEQLILNLKNIGDNIQCKFFEIGKKLNAITEADIQQQDTDIKRLNTQNTNLTSTIEKITEKTDEFEQNMNDKSFENICKIIALMDKNIEDMENDGNILNNTTRKRILTFNQKHKIDRKRFDYQKKADDGIEKLTELCNKYTDNIKHLKDKRDKYMKFLKQKFLFNLDGIQQVFKTSQNNNEITVSTQKVMENETCISKCMEKTNQTDDIKFDSEQTNNELNKYDMNFKAHNVTIQVLQNRLKSLQTEIGWDKIKNDKELKSKMECLGYVMCNDYNNGLTQQTEIKSIKIRSKLVNIIQRLHKCKNNSIKTRNEISKLHLHKNILQSKDDNYVSWLRQNEDELKEHIISTQNLSNTMENEENEMSDVVYDLMDVIEIMKKNGIDMDDKINAVITKGKQLANAVKQHSNGNIGEFVTLSKQERILTDKLQRIIDQQKDAISDIIIDEEKDAIYKKILMKNNENDSRKYKNILIQQNTQRQMQIDLIQIMNLMNRKFNVQKLSEKEEDELTNYVKQIGETAHTVQANANILQKLQQFVQNSIYDFSCDERDDPRIKDLLEEIKKYETFCYDMVKQRDTSLKRVSKYKKLLDVEYDKLRETEMNLNHLLLRTITQTKEDKQVAEIYCELNISAINFKKENIYSTDSENKILFDKNMRKEMAYYYKTDSAVRSEMDKVNKMKEKMKKIQDKISVEEIKQNNINMPNLINLKDVFLAYIKIAEIVNKKNSNEDYMKNALEELHFPKVLLDRVMIKITALGLNDIDLWLQMDEADIDAQLKEVGVEAMIWRKKFIKYLKDKKENNAFDHWFKNVLELPQYQKLFVKAGYENLEYFEEDIDEDELINDVGIKSKPHRRKILREIKKLCQQKNH